MDRYRDGPLLANPMILFAPATFSDDLAWQPQTAAEPTLRQKRSNLNFKIHDHRPLYHR